MKVLIFGLSGSGKTTLSRELAYHFQLPHYNADTIREFYDDWDFSTAGRVRSTQRMSQFEFGVLDFICPHYESRKLINPDYCIWMDTISECKFEDTNQMFETPTNLPYIIRITKWIGLDQLHNSLADFNPGIEGIRNYLNGPFQKLVK
jgi:GTPase SAR1 family protein